MSLPHKFLEQDKDLEVLQIFRNVLPTLPFIFHKPMAFVTFDRNSKIKIGINATNPGALKQSIREVFFSNRNFVLNSGKLRSTFVSLSPPG